MGVLRPSPRHTLYDALGAPQTFIRADPAFRRGAARTPAKRERKPCMHTAAVRA
jgi:hypothetical protein